MTRPKYALGTKVRFAGKSAQDGGPAEFEIVSRDFLDTREPSYLIRSLSNLGEQSVREDEIVAPGVRIPSTVVSLIRETVARDECGAD